MPALPPKPSEPCPKTVLAGDLAEHPGPMPVMERAAYSSESATFYGDEDLLTVIQSILQRDDLWEQAPAPVHSAVQSLSTMLETPEYTEALGMLYVGPDTNGDLEAYFETLSHEASRRNREKSEEWDRKKVAWDAARLRAHQLNEETAPLRQQWYDYNSALRRLRGAVSRKKKLEAKLAATNAQLDLASPEELAALGEAEPETSEG
mgnify:CR=1 FL=1|tara:strand:- start:6610 stop:7227 length:618 start_codon:yes stop_codon:yes gene_type:complete